VALSQLLAGLNKPTSGSICIQRYGDSGEHKGPPEHLSPEKVGIVFQFPERYRASLDITERKVDFRVDCAMITEARFFGPWNATRYKILAWPFFFLSFL